MFITLARAMGQQSLVKDINILQRPLINYIYFKRILFNPIIFIACPFFSNFVILINVVESVKRLNHNTVSKGNNICFFIARVRIIDLKN